MTSIWQKILAEAPLEPENVRREEWSRREGQSRLDDRHLYEAGVTLQLDSGLSFRGRTVNISKLGAFVLMGRPPMGAKCEDQGVATVTLFIQGRMFTSATPCRVARICENGIGILFAESPPLEETEPAA